jgi:hypothetical protein
MIRASIPPTGVLVGLVGLVAEILPSAISSLPLDARDIAALKVQLEGKPPFSTVKPLLIRPEFRSLSAVWNYPVACGVTAGLETKERREFSSAYKLSVK